MYPNENISSYSSNPSTPVNSPPPLTSQSHGPSSTGASTWQQLTPVVSLNGSSSVQTSSGSGPAGPGPGVTAIGTGINGMQNGNYTPDLVVPRELHMVSSVFTFLIKKLIFFSLLLLDLNYFFFFSNESKLINFDEIIYLCLIVNYFINDC